MSESILFPLETGGRAEASDSEEGQFDESERDFSRASPPIGLDETIWRAPVTDPYVNRRPRRIFVTTTQPNQRKRERQRKKKKEKHLKKSSRWSFNGKKSAKNPRRNRHSLVLRMMFVQKWTVLASVCEKNLEIDPSILCTISIRSKLIRILYDDKNRINLVLLSNIGVVKVDLGHKRASPALSTKVSFFAFGKQPMY